MRNVKGPVREGAWPCACLHTCCAALLLRRCTSRCAAAVLTARPLATLLAGDILTLLESEREARRLR